MSDLIHKHWKEWEKLTAKQMRERDALKTKHLRELKQERAKDATRR